MATYEAGAAGVEEQHAVLVLAPGAGAEVMLRKVGGMDEGLEAGIDHGEVGLRRRERVDGGVEVGALHDAGVGEHEIEAPGRPKRRVECPRQRPVVRHVGPVEVRVRHPRRRRPPVRLVPP